MSLEHSPARSALRSQLDPMLRAHEVGTVMGWSRTTLWRRVRDGLFPAPKAIGPQMNGWPSSVVLRERDKLPDRTYQEQEDGSQPKAGA